MNLEEWKAKLETEGEISDVAFVPLQRCLLGLTNVTKDKERKNVPTPYLKAEIVIPHQFATSIQELLKSDYAIAVMFFKKKEGKK